MLVWWRLTGDVRFYDQMTQWAVVFIAKVTVIYSHGHRLRTLVAVPRSTELSTSAGWQNYLSGWIMTTNGNGWCRLHQPTGRLMVQVGRLGLRVGGHLVLYYILQTNRLNSRKLANKISNLTINLSQCNNNK